jgi:hypothetical protein
VNVVHDYHPRSVRVCSECHMCVLLFGMIIIGLFDLLRVNGTPPAAKRGGSGIARSSSSWTVELIINGVYVLCAWC